VDDDRPAEANAAQDVERLWRPFDGVDQEALLREKDRGFAGAGAEVQRPAARCGGPPAGEWILRRRRDEDQRTTLA
jgi:hypothetical protein